MLGIFFLCSLGVFSQHKSDHPEIEKQITELLHQADGFKDSLNYQKAAETLESAKNILAKHELPETQIKTLITLGGVYYQLGVFPKAYENYTLALLLTKKHNKPLFQAKAQAELAHIL